MKKSAITTASLDDARRGRTDWQRVKAQTDAEIEAAIAGDPDAAPTLDAAWFERAETVMPEPKVAISLRVDRDVIEWFKARGSGYQTRMNAVLRSFMDLSNKSPRRPE